MILTVECTNCKALTETSFPKLFKESSKDHLPTVNAVLCRCTECGETFMLYTYRKSADERGIFTASTSEDPDVAREKFMARLSNIKEVSLKEVCE